MLLMMAVSVEPMYSHQAGQSEPCQWPASCPAFARCHRSAPREALVLVPSSERRVIGTELSGARWCNTSSDPPDRCRNTPTSRGSGQRPSEPCRHSRARAYRCLRRKPTAGAGGGLADRIWIDAMRLGVVALLDEHRMRDGVVIQPGDVP